MYDQAFTFPQSSKVSETWKFTTISKNLMIPHNNIDMQLHYMHIGFVGLWPQHNYPGCVDMSQPNHPGFVGLSHEAIPPQPTIQGLLAAQINLTIDMQHITIITKYM